MSAPDTFAVPAIRLLGPSGCGKTTLAERLVPALGARGYRVGVVKSARHHDAPRDRPGADTARLAQAGATAVAGVFADGVVMRVPAPSLATLLAMCAPACDLVLVEGFHDAALPALLFEGAERRAAGSTAIARIALATLPERHEMFGEVPVFHRDEVEAIAHVIAVNISRHESFTEWGHVEPLKRSRNRFAIERWRSVHLRGIQS